MDTTAYRQKVDALQTGELAGIPGLTLEEVRAGLARWHDEQRAIESAWAQAERLPVGHPEREALADRDGLARLAVRAYEDAQRAHVVAGYRARGDAASEFRHATGLGLIRPEQW